MTGTNTLPVTIPAIIVGNSHFDCTVSDVAISTWPDDVEARSILQL